MNEVDFGHTNQLAIKFLYSHIHKFRNKHAVFPVLKIGLSLFRRCMHYLAMSLQGLLIQKNMVPCIYMDKQSSPVGAISLEDEKSLTGMKNLPYKHLQAGWPGCRGENYFQKLPYMVKQCYTIILSNVKTTKMEFSHINTSYQAVRYRQRMICDYLLLNLLYVVFSSL